MRNAQAPWNAVRASWSNVWGAGDSAVSRIYLLYGKLDHLEVEESYINGFCTGAQMMLKTLTGQSENLRAKKQTGVPMLIFHLLYCILLRNGKARRAVFIFLP